MDIKKIAIASIVILLIGFAGGYFYCRYSEKSAGGDAEATIAELKTENDDLNNKLSAADNENKKLSLENTVTGTAITGTGNYISSADKELASISGESAGTTLKITAARADLKAASAETAIALKENSAEAATIKEQSAAIAAAQKDAADEKALIEKANSEIKTLEHKAVVKERQEWVVGIAGGILAYEAYRHG